MRFGEQTKKVTLPIKTPAPAPFNNLETSFITPIQQDVVYPAFRILVGDLEGLLTTTEWRSRSLSSWAPSPPLRLVVVALRVRSYSPTTHTKHFYPNPA